MARYVGVSVLMLGVARVSESRERGGGARRALWFYCSVCGGSLIGLLGLSLVSDARSPCEKNSADGGKQRGI